MLSFLNLEQKQSEQKHSFPLFSGTKSTGAYHSDMAAYLTLGLNCLQIYAHSSSPVFGKAQYGCVLNILASGPRSIIITVTLISPSWSNHIYSWFLTIVHIPFCLLNETWSEISATPNSCYHLHIWCSCWSVRYLLILSMSWALTWHLQNLFILSKNNKQINCIQHLKFHEALCMHRTTAYHLSW